MGQEVQCRLRVPGQNPANGVAQLESGHLMFRGSGPASRLKIELTGLKRVEAHAGVLELDYDGGTAALELGGHAEKWAQKILHPPTRMEKLGIKSGQRVSLVGAFDDAFLAELTASSQEVSMKPAAGSDWILLLAADGKQLEKVPPLRAKLAGNGGLWIVYPKGSKAITQDDVFQAARGAGLKDTKVMSFSATHTALKFVPPLSERKKR